MTKVSQGVKLSEVWKFEHLVQVEWVRHICQPWVPQLARRHGAKTQVRQALVVHCRLQAIVRVDLRLPQVQKLGKETPQILTDFNWF